MDLLLATALGLDLILHRWMNVDFIGRTGGIELRSLAPVVATGVGKQVALGIEGRARYRLSNGLKGLQTLLVVLVPKGDYTIGTDRGKGSKLIVKCNGVDAVHIAILSVTLEGKMILVSHLLDVLDSDTAFDTADGKARLVGKAADTARVVFEGRLFAGMFPGLWTADIVNQDVSGGGAHHHQISSDVQVVDSFGHLVFTGGAGTASVPEL